MRRSTQIKALTPDLVIMDIQMPGRNGLRAAADIEVEPRPELVFVTAHEHYAPDAFEVDAADYLLKPVRFDRLRQAVGPRPPAPQDAGVGRAGRSSSQDEVESLRAKGALPAPEEDGFWVPERNGQRRVPIESIDWIEAARDYVLLHTQVRSHLLQDHDVGAGGAAGRLAAAAGASLGLRAAGSGGGGEEGEPLDRAWFWPTARKCRSARTMSMRSRTRWRMNQD